MSNRPGRRLSRRHVLAGLGASASTVFIGTGSAVFSKKPLPQNTPSIIGHRGAAGLAPPNTRAAIEKALQFNVDGVELDVRQTADGTLVLFHDPILDLATDESGLVSETPSETVLDAEIRGQEILTLDEGLELVRDAGVRLYLEVKEVGYTLDILARVSEYDVAGKTTIVSFDSEPLKVANESDLSVRTGLIGSVPNPNLLKLADFLNVDIVLAHYVPQATPWFINSAKQQGFTAGIWSLVDTESSIRDALESNPDVITTNRPDIVLQMLSQKSRV